MQNPQDGQPQPPPSSSTVSTTTVQGPVTSTTTTHTTAGGSTTVRHYGPQSTTVTAPTITTRAHIPAPRSSTPQQDPQPQRLHSSSIRIRRPSAPQSIPVAPVPQPTTNDDWQGNRRRSSSEPRAPPAALLHDDAGLQRHVTATPALQPLYEENSHGEASASAAAGPPPSRGGAMARIPLSRQISAISIRRRDHEQHNLTMQPNVVDVLDVIGQYTQLHS